MSEVSIKRSMVQILPYRTCGAKTLSHTEKITDLSQTVQIYHHVLHIDGNRRHHSLCKQIEKHSLLK